jgi:hypothetical protein
VSALILDAGALIAVDRDDRAMIARLRVAHSLGLELRTTGIVVAEVWRDGSGRQSNLARLLKSVDVRVYYLGSGEWQDETGGYAGISTAAQTSATELQGGIEETNTTIDTCGHLTGIGYYDANENAHNGWSDSSNGNGYFRDPQQPPSIAWDTTPSALRDWGNESCSASASTLADTATALSNRRFRRSTAWLTTTAHRQARAPQAHVASALSPTQIADLATQVAAEEGDASPTLIQYGNASTRAAANAVTSGETVPGANASTIIEERGNFVGMNVPIPSGVAPPTGDVLTIVVDNATGEITDLGIQNSYPSLSSFGGATTISNSQ